MPELECQWPDYDRTFTFSVKYGEWTLWDDGGKMPQSLRLLLNNAVLNLSVDSTSTLSEEVHEWAGVEVELIQKGLKPRPLNGLR